jgi:hypothetical protein
VLGNELQGTPIFDEDRNVHAAGFSNNNTTATSRVSAPGHSLAVQTHKPRATGVRIPRDAPEREAARSTRALSYSSGFESPTSATSARFSMRAARDGPPCTTGVLGGGGVGFSQAAGQGTRDELDF